MSDPLSPTPLSDDADPAPVGLTEDERVTVDWLRDSGDPWDRRVLAIIDRLVPVSPSVDPEEKP